MRWLVPLVMLVVVLDSCSASSELLSHHTVSYKVSATHPDDSVQQFMSRQPLIFYVQFTNDTLYAFYDYGLSELHHIAFGADTAILAANYDNHRFMSYLNARAIAQYLEMRSPYMVNVQPGTVEYDTLTCRRALLIYPDGRSSQLLFSKKWEAPNRQYDYGFRQVEGLPVKFTVIEGEMKYQFVLDAIRPYEQPIEIPSLNRYEVVDPQLLLNRGVNW